MSRLMSSYDELVDQFKQELLNDEQKLDKFEERFEERLAARSKREEERQKEYIS